MKLKIWCLLAVLLGGIGLSGAGADELRDFEEDANRSSKPDGPPSDRDDPRHPPKRDHHFEAEGWEDACFKIAILSMGVGLAQSLERVNGEGDNPRQVGEPLIPFVRLDGAWQDVTGDVEAVDTYIQGGYGPLALDYRHTRYTESQPRSHLDLHWAHVLARMSYGDQVEADLGLGGFWMEGATHSSGTSFTTALLVYPDEHWGVEFRPTWASLDGGSTIRDCDLALHLRQGVASVKLGYRWVKSPHITLDGPYAGLVFRW